MKEKQKETRFNIYRFQILPVEQIQLNLFEETLSVDELKERKNEFFLTALLGIKEFYYSRAEIIFKIEQPQENILALKLGVNREQKIDNRDFEEEVVDNWPSALVVFDNNPHVQKVAIEIEYKAFQNVSTIVDILDKNLNDALLKYNLYVTIQPIFDKNRFWNVVEKYPQRITETEFKMISPNMSNISNNLKVDLVAWNKITNTQETKINLKSDENSHLTFKDGDEPVSSIVNYSSSGGGNITIKVRGLSRKISTNDKVIEIGIKDFEFDFHPDNLPYIGEVFKKLLEE